MSVIGVSRRQEPLATGAAGLYQGMRPAAASIAVFLVMIHVAIMLFGLLPYAQDLGKAAGIVHWTVWLNVPFSAVVGWLFVSLEKVKGNSSNPFEGGSNDVPISFMKRRIEIEMRGMLGEQTDLETIQARHDIQFWSAFHSS